MTNISKDDFILFSNEDAVIQAYVAQMAEKFPKLGEERVRLAFANEIRALRAAWKAWRKAFHTSKRQGAFAIAINSVVRAHNPGAGCRKRGAHLGG
jgi:hypothetical protein